MPRDDDMVLHTKPPPPLFDKRPRHITATLRPEYFDDIKQLLRDIRDNEVEAKVVRSAFRTAPTTIFICLHPVDDQHARMIAGDIYGVDPAADVRIEDSDQCDGRHAQDKSA